MKKLLVVVLVLAFVGVAQANLLENPGFETGDLTGWTPVGAPVTVVNTQAHTGSYSLAITGAGNGWWACPHAYQIEAAGAGDNLYMSGYMLETIAATGNTWGTIKMEFKDAAGLNLTPENITKGQLDGAGQPYVGVVGLPQLGAAGPVGSWVFTELQASAPVGTVEVRFYVMTVDGGPVADTIYFDDIVVPEPATLALLGLGGLFLRRRK